MMKKFVLTFFMAAVVLLAATPAQAQVWRSSTGNIFRFHSDYSVDVLNVDGGSSHGRWWWGYAPHHGVFELWGDNTTYHVYVEGSSARVYFNGKTTYWSYMGSRGAEEEGGERYRGWFMPVPSSIRPLKK